MAQINLELQLKLNDRLSAGMKAALKAMQNDTRSAKREMDALARAANNIKPTGVERLLKGLREVKNLAKSSMDMLNRAAQAGAAVAAGGYVAKRFSDKPMAFDRQLALTSNVAFSDRSVAGRIAGKAELEKAVRQAQKLGLGSQEDVLQTLNDLIGSGAMGSGAAGVKSSMNLLPTIAAASSGTGADPQDIAKIVMAAKQNMDMSDAEVKQFISKAITSGNLGGFELKDMARYLPEQMASYAASGMKGMRGGEDLLALNQVARITAGNPDQAGNNVVNLLNKMTSNDSQKDFQKQGINLIGSLANNRGKGMSTLDAFLGLVDQVAGKNPEYKKLQAKAATQKGADQKQTFEAMMDLMEQGGLGSVVQDRQAMSALLGARQNGARMNEIRDAVRKDDGSQIDKNMAVVNASASASAERLANAKDKAATDAFGAAEGPLKRFLDGVSSSAERFPILAAASYSAAAALSAVAAAAGVGVLFKGGAAGAAATGTAARVGAALPAAAAGAGALATAAMPVAALGATGFLAYAAATRMGAGDLLKDTKFGDQIGEAIARALAAFGNKEAKQALEVNLHLDGQKINAAVETRQTKQARRH